MGGTVFQQCRQFRRLAAMSKEDATSRRAIHAINPLAVDMTVTTPAPATHTADVELYHRLHSLQRQALRRSRGLTDRVRSYSDAILVRDLAKVSIVWTAVQNSRRRDDIYRYLT